MRGKGKSGDWQTPRFESGAPAHGKPLRGWAWHCRARRGFAWPGKGYTGRLAAIGVRGPDAHAGQSWAELGMADLGWARQGLGYTTTAQNPRARLRVERRRRLNPRATASERASNASTAAIAASILRRDCGCSFAIE